MMALAKISGSTPEAFIFSGMCVDWPPYILRPTMRLEYWIGMRRSPRSTNTMPMISTMKMSTDAITDGSVSPTPGP